MRIKINRPGVSVSINVSFLRVVAEVCAGYSFVSLDVSPFRLSFECAVAYSVKEIFNRAQNRQLNEIRVAAGELMGERLAACKYLCRPHILLKGEMPFAVAARSTEGYEQVRDMIGRAIYGVGI